MMVKASPVYGNSGSIDMAAITSTTLAQKPEAALLVNPLIVLGNRRPIAHDGKVEDSLPGPIGG
jgi:hypothetical protein